MYKPKTHQEIADRITGILSFVVILLFLVAPIIIMFNQGVIQ